MAEITEQTQLSDRALLVHLVQHVEAMHDRIEALAEEFEVFRPLLARFRPGKGADYLTIMQTARELRRGSNGKPRS